MVIVSLVWLFLAPLGAWVIGAGIRVPEQRRVVVEVGGSAGDQPGRQSDDLVVVGAGPQPPGGTSGKQTGPEDLRAFTGRTPRALLPPWRRALLRLAGL